MMILGVGSVLVGAILGLRLKVMAVGIAAVLGIAVVAVAGVVQGHALWTTILSIGAFSVGLEIGYLGTSFIRCVVGASRLPRLCSKQSPLVPTSS
jgi:hypothetical protein